MLFSRHLVRRFVWVLSALVALFVVAEIVAMLRLVPHLEPVSFHALITNPLFAIGFGGPLLLHLSSLPRWRELVVTIALAAAIAGLSIFAAGEHTAMQWVIGAGAASTLVLGVRSARGDREALHFLLPSLITLFFTLEAAMFLDVISNVRPLTFDGNAYVADASIAGDVAFRVGRLFAASPLLAAICTAIYLAPPPGLIFVYALQVKKERPPIDIVTTLVAMGVIGYSLYFLFPVCGPKFAFGAAFPQRPPDVATLAGTLTAVPPFPRNGIPSLHMASALIALLHARRYGRIAAGVAWIFVIGTFLATMGTGEHYLVDLLVAVPFTLAVDALLRRRFVVALPAIAVFLLWLAAIRWGSESALVMWTLIALSGATFFVERMVGKARTAA